jgi:glucokinase
VSATVGVDVGGTNVRAALVDDDGSVLAESRVDTPGPLPELLAAVESVISAVEAGAASDRRGPVGIGAAGMISRAGGVHYAPNVLGLVGVPLAEALSTSLARPVVVDNDANVAALAELRLGAARGARHALVITLGTGIGGGIVMDGAVVRGAHGFAGEIGHFQIDPHGPRCACGGIGHWEAVASGPALGELARGRGVGESGPEVAHAAVAGDPDALEVVVEYAGRVALGLAGLVNILDPELVVVSGGLVEIGEALLGPLRAAFDPLLEGAEHRPRVPVVAAELGSRAGVVGAALLAREHTP